MERRSMEKDAFEKMRRRLIMDFLDVIFLRALMSRPMGGHDFIAFISKRFDTLISSGTVYSTLYSMERQGLIEGGRLRAKRVYTLTPKGKETINAVSKTEEKILSTLANILAGRRLSGS